jgi:hypothetical protein
MRIRISGVCFSRVRWFAPYFIGLFITVRLFIVVTTLRIISSVGCAGTPTASTGISHVIGPVSMKVYVATILPRSWSFISPSTNSPLSPTGSGTPLPTPKLESSSDSTPIFSRPLTLSLK